MGKGSRKDSKRSSSLSRRLMAQPCLRCSPFVYSGTQTMQSSLPGSSSCNLSLPSGADRAQPPCQQLESHRTALTPLRTLTPTPRSRPLCPASPSEEPSSKGEPEPEKNSPQRYQLCAPTEQLVHLLMLGPLLPPLPQTWPAPCLTCRL